MTNSIFEEAWWLDAVAPGQWECLEVRDNNGEVTGRWPLCHMKLLGCKAIKNPPYTQTLGPWIRTDATRYTSYLSAKKKILEELISRIPRRPRNFYVTLDSSNEYVLPFRWNGFQIAPSFSYRFPQLDDLEAIYHNIDPKQRSVIKKASETLTVKEDCSLDVLLGMMQMTNDRQNRKKGLNKEVIRRIDDACREHGARKLLVAVDAQNQVHAAAYLVYDARVCYYLFGGANPAFRSSGAQTFLIWEAIKFAATVSKAFDFEGSNVEAIEKHFRSFGAPFVVNYTVKRLSLALTLADTFAFVFKKYVLKQHM